MELFLNILWSVIAVAGLCVWRLSWAGQPRQGEHASWRQWTAFVCALVLLFFMVSLTDDLHSELVVFEECSAGRRHAACQACPQHVTQKPDTAKIFHPILALPSFAYALAQTGLVIPERQSAQNFFQARRSFGRAPPPASL
jgi:hypothetical protein